MILTETLVEKTKKIEGFNAVIIILNTTKNKKILGLTCTEWLQRELKGYPLYVLNPSNNENIREKIIPCVQNYDYFILIYNNTPFITKELVNNVIEYVWFKNSNACKLYSGAVYKSKYYLTNNEIVYDNFYMQNQDLFAFVENTEQIAFAEKYFSKKIITTYQKNGVIFENPNSVIISPNCQIGRGTTILNNCIIKGKTIIGENSIINNNSTIIDSVIGNKSSISNSNITKCKIGNNVIVSPYCDITKSKIEDNVFVESYCLIDNYKINKNEFVKARSTLQKNKGAK